ncbi:MAG: cation transporter [bacterium]|nr:cation transporter [bacterium]
MHEHDPAHAHGHGHAHGPSASLSRPEQRRRLAWTLALAAAYMVAEVVGGFWTGSLALLADAGHMLSDVAALALSLVALWLAERPAPVARTFGYRRSEILAALANGTALVVVAIFILIEAWERSAAPPEVLGLPMLAIATGGLLVNILGLFLLHGGRDASLNLRGAWLHLLSDALGSVGAMTAGLCVWLFGWTLADPIASAVIAVLVLASAWTLLRETVDVLLESAPRHLDVDEIGRELRNTAGVASVHDLHVWTITSGMVSLSCHVACRDDTPPATLLGELQDLLRERFGIEHGTIQVGPRNFEESVEVC